MLRTTIILITLLTATASWAQNIEKRLEAVDDYILEGNYEYAEKLLVKILGKDEGIHEAHYKLAMVFWQTNKPKKGLEEAVKAVQQKPENANYQALLAKLWLENGQFDKALEAFDAALLYDDQLPEVYLYRGDHYAEIEEWDLALSDYEVLSNLVSEDPEVLFRLAHVHQALLHYKKAANLYERALRINPLDHESRYALAICQYKNGMYSDAIFQLNQLINMNGAHIDYLYQRALCYIDTKQLPKAKVDLLKARELDKNQLDVNYALIGVEERQGNYDRALLLLDQSIARFGGMQVQHLWKGRLLAKQGDFKAAYRNFVFAAEGSGEASKAFSGELNTYLMLMAYLGNEKEWMPETEECNPSRPYVSFLGVCLEPETESERLECLSERELNLFKGVKGTTLFEEGPMHFITALRHLRSDDKEKCISALDRTTYTTDFSNSIHHFAMVLLEALEEE